MDEIYNQRFELARNKVASESAKRNGIGTYGEKCLHLILKYTFEPDDTKHEIKCGSFYADIMNGDGITEIHTRSFNTLVKKLDSFLDMGKVRIVYPIPRIKKIVWIDNESGEVTEPRKSPKTGSYYHCFYELVKIKKYLGHKNLTFTPLLLDVTEYRNLNGWSKDKKKGSSREDRIPDGLVDFIDIKNANDYKKLIPIEDGGEFTVKELAKKAKISTKVAYSAVSVLKHLDLIEVKCKKGRAFVYSVK